MIHHWLTAVWKCTQIRAKFQCFKVQTNISRTIARVQSKIWNCSCRLREDPDDLLRRQEQDDHHRGAVRPAQARLQAPVQGRQGDQGHPHRGQPRREAAAEDGGGAAAAAGEERQAAEEQGEAPRC